MDNVKTFAMTSRSPRGVCVVRSVVKEVGMLVINQRSIVFLLVLDTDTKSCRFLKILFGTLLSCGIANVANGDEKQMYRSEIRRQRKVLSTSTFPQSAARVLFWV